MSVSASAQQDYFTFCFRNQTPLEDTTAIRHRQSTSIRWYFAFGAMLS